MNRDRLDELYRELVAAAECMAGYPENQVFDYEELFRFLRFSINNCGDPFVLGSTYRLNTHEFERELLLYFELLFRAEARTTWGYVTNGGTEGNLFGLYLARELYPDGIVYASTDTHYSIRKNLQLLQMEHSWVPALENGEIDYAALRQQLAARIGRPPIFVANIGTTMKGAVDSVPKIRALLRELGIERSYIHCDAALFGMLLPFLPADPDQAFDFQAGVDSLAFSGHKMIGMPMPCGVVLAKRAFVDNIGREIEYTGTKDNTITGSRNGISPLFLWYTFFVRQREQQLRTIARESIDNADYAIEQMKARGIAAWRNKNSNIVVFPRPHAKVRIQWQLAAEGRWAHIIVLPQVTRAVIQRIIEDLQH
jgi:histidine decarboxylase